MAPSVVGWVRRSAASSNRHQASPRNCQTMLYARELSLTADPFVGSSVAEQEPPAGERHTNAMRSSRDDDSLGSCLDRAREAGRDRRGVCATVRMVALVETPQTLDGFGREDRPVEALRFDAQPVIERSALPRAGGLQVGAQRGLG